MNSRSLLLAAAALLLGSAQSARGEYQFTGSAYFPPGGAPLTTGAGQLTFGVTAPADLPDGFVAARGYVLRYATAVADVSHDVLITWTADRDFLSAALPSYTTIAITFRAELSSEGGGLGLAYEAETRHRLFGGPSAVSVSDSFDLMPGNAVVTASQSATSATFVPPGGVPDSLRPTVRFTLTPTQAGQDLRITFTPNGVISTGNNVGDMAAVPAPSGLVLVLCALPLLGAMWTRWSYGKRA